MKRNLSLLLIAGYCAGACWSTNIISQVTAAEEVDQDIRLKSSVEKILPNGTVVVETPEITPVGGRTVMREAPSQKGYTLDSLVCVRPDGSFYSKQLFTYTPAGKIAEEKDYLFDAATESWKISNHYIWTWDENGYMLSDEQISSTGSALKNEYKYNDQNLGIEKLTLRRANADSEYVNYRKGNYDYDERGNMTLEAISVWTDGQWVLNSKTEATYDANNYRASIEIWKLKSGKWVGDEKKEYVNNALGLNTSLLNYSWERETPGTFEPFSRLTQIFKEDDPTFLVTQKFEYYNLDNKDWNGNFYDRGGAERVNQIGSKEFDDKGRVTLSYAEALIGNEWRRGSYSTYTYTDNSDGSYECVKNSYLRARDVEEFDHKEIVTTRYDARGNETYNFDKVLFDLKRSNEIIKTFDDQDNEIVMEHNKLDPAGNVYPYIKAVNTYDNWHNIIETYNYAGKKNEQGVPDSWIYSSHFTYSYDMDGTVRTDKRRYKYVAESDSWANDFGEGADFDYSVPVSDILIPVGYNADYMQTAKYSYKGNGDDWDTTKYTFYYTKNERDGINDVVTSKDSNVTFSHNILRVNGGTTIDNTVYGTNGMIVYTGHNAEEDLSHLDNGLYIVRSIVDGKTTTLKVVVR